MLEKVEAGGRGREALPAEGGVDRGVQCEGTWYFWVVARGEWLEREVFYVKGICVQVTRF